MLVINTKKRTMTHYCYKCGAKNITYTAKRTYFETNPGLMICTKCEFPTLYGNTTQFGCKWHSIVTGDNLAVINALNNSVTLIDALDALDAYRTKKYYKIRDLEYAYTKYVCKHFIKTHIDAIVYSMYDHYIVQDYCKQFLKKKRK